MEADMKKLAILHTTPVTIPVMKALIRERMEQIEIINLLDDSILPEINTAGRITEEVRNRIACMMRMAKTAGAEAILSACSSIGGAVEETGRTADIPVYRIDEPMAEKAIGYGRIGVAATLASTIEPTTELVRRKAAQKGREPKVECLVMKEAGALLNAGREDEYNELVRKELERLAGSNDIVVLAQASMARAIDGLTEEERKKYLTSPVSGVEAVLSEMWGWEKQGKDKE